MHGLFVTGTDTGVGKTLFSAALLLHLGASGIRAAACKPVSAGCRRDGSRLINADGELLASAAPLGRALECVNPVALEPAIAPSIAADEKGVTLRAATLAAACRQAGHGADFLVVEGAGGWRVPLNSEETLADVARLLKLPVVLVVGMRLGCLSHALLSAEAIRRDGLPLAGWVANTLDPKMPRLDANIATLCHWLDAPLLAHLPHRPDGSEIERARELAAALNPLGTAPFARAAALDLV